MIKSFKFKLKLLLSASIFFGAFNMSLAQEGALSEDATIIGNGETLFNNNCAVCHAIHEQVVGPALKNVHERKDLPWLASFIRNSQKVIQSGDEYAVNLYNEYNQTEMTSFDFNDDEIIAILSYVKQQSAIEPVAAVAAPVDGAQPAAGQASGLSNTYVTIILVALLVVLVLILVVLAVLISVLTKYLRQKDLGEEEKEIIEQRFVFADFIKSPGFIWLSTFVFTAIVLKFVLDGLLSVGIQQGYAPTQPIAFSHKIHAGQYEIECQYCHTGVTKSKSANIPSANICMNCHSIVKTESPEIQKIWTAVENDQPIEWIRVHNLPDLAYFNHAQHYKVGGIECQTCHGEIQEMEVVAQHSTLTMGWCIDCHKDTQIKADNPYYNKLVEIHESSSKSPMTVEDIGGLECAKCHY